MQSSWKKKTLLCIGFFSTILVILFVFAELRVSEVSAAMDKHDFVGAGQCNPCHKPHAGTDYFRIWERDPRPNPATAGIPIEDASSVGCLDCHAWDFISDLPDINGLFGWGGWPTPPRIYDNNGDFVTASNHAGGTGMKCTLCHPHENDFAGTCEICHGGCVDHPVGSPMYGAPDYPNAGAGLFPDLCEGCHIPNKPPSTPPWAGIHNELCTNNINANSHENHLISGGRVCKDCHYLTIQDTDPSDGWMLLPGAYSSVPPPLHLVEGFHMNPWGPSSGMPLGYTWATGPHPINLDSEKYGHFGYKPYGSEPYEEHEGYYKWNHPDNNIRKR